MSNTKPKEGTSTKGKKMHFSVGALIRNKEGEMLLLDRVKPPFGWAGPAGHVDEGETSEKAISREIKEETGYSVTSIKLLHEEEIPGNECGKGVETHYWYLFECEIAGERKRNTAETKALGWHSEEEILDLEIEPVWKYWFKKEAIINKEITICSSGNFTPEIIKLKNKLKKQKNLVNIPYFTKLIDEGKLTFEEYVKEKEVKGDIELREKHEKEAGVDFYFRYDEFIKRSDAILVLNLEKNGIENYIGGNTFLEIYDAYINHKPVYFYNPIPERSKVMHYVDELEDFKPTIINGDLSLIK